jgi:hypothetical protein
MVFYSLMGQKTHHPLSSESAGHSVFCPLGSFLAFNSFFTVMCSLVFSYTLGGNPLQVTRNLSAYPSFIHYSVLQPLKLLLYPDSCLSPQLKESTRQCLLCGLVFLLKKLCGHGISVSLFSISQGLVPFTALHLATNFPYVLSLFW